MQIRKATRNDMEFIKELYRTARRYMRTHGNALQWGPSDMPEDHMPGDIQRGDCYVGVDENDRPRFVFSFILGTDNCYRRIDGAWLNDEPYGAIHRVASDRTTPDVIGKIVEYCEGTITNLRCDTHELNTTMQEALERNGFQRCGIIRNLDNTERVAFQRCR